MPETPQCPSILVFDVNETLLDITTLEPLFARVFADPGVLREWFAQLILYSQSMSLSGIYAPFGSLAVAVLKMIGSIHRKPVTAADAEELQWRIKTMPAHAEVYDSLVRLKNAGFRLVTLTNSSSDTRPDALDRAGLSELLEHRFSVETVRRFKPAPEVYHQVCDTLQAAPANLCLVAAHTWDTLGAQAQGWAGALITRPGNSPLPDSAVPQPALIAANLADLADQMLARWR